ncbi:MAG: zinc-ribbon domain-containing protein [Polyangiaceae bacterium]|nr:zinc-ribbon domain-containing protein [Polyangiaceae bacterium]
MNVTCTSCDAKYVVPDEKVAGRRIRIRCRHCDTPMVIDGTSIAAGAAPPSSAEAPSSSKAANTPSSSVPPEPAAVSQMPPTAQDVALPPAGASDAHAPSVATATATPRRRRVRSEFSRTMVGGFTPAAGSAPEPPTTAAAPAGFGGPEPPRLPDAPAAPEPPRWPARTARETSPWVVALPEGALEDTSTQQVVQLFAAGRVTDDVLLWKEGMAQWQRPFDIPEIKLELLARGFTPPIVREAASTSSSRARTSAAPSSTGFCVTPRDLDHGRALPASPWQMRGPEPEPSTADLDVPLPRDWQSVFDRPSRASLTPARNAGAANRSYHPPSSVPPPSRSAALGSAPAERRPAPVSVPPSPLSTRSPSPLPGAANASKASSRPSPPRSRAPSPASKRPPPQLARRAGAVPLPAAARQRQPSELDIQIDFDATQPRAAAWPAARHGTTPSVRPALVAPSLPEVTYPQARRHRTLWHLLLILVLLCGLAVVFVRITHRPAVVYTATSLALDRFEALLPR